MKHQFPLKNVQQEKRIFRSRVFFAIGFVSFFLLILLSRYAYLQIVHYEQFKEAADKNRIRLQPISPARGYIYDRNGILLADNYPVFTATLSKADVQDVDETVERLKSVIDLSEEDIDRFLNRIKTAKKDIFTL